MTELPTAPTGVQVGDILSGTITKLDRRDASVLLDGFPDGPLGLIHSFDMYWRSDAAGPPVVGDRVTAEAIAVGDPIRLARTATEHPELWAFLKSLRSGGVLTGVVASIESFGVFIALDEGPPHPVFPGVGFVTHPEVSWGRECDVLLGQRVAGAFLCFDTVNGEARMSLKALLPDPFRPFADRTRAGDVRAGTVTKVVPFGVFVRVAPDIEGLVPSDELSCAVREGERLRVSVTDIDSVRRRVTLALAD